MKIAVDCRYIGKSGIGTYIENIVYELIQNHPEHQYLFICEKGTKLLAKENVELLETDIQPFSLKELLFFPVEVINQYDAFFSPYFNIPMGVKVPVYCTIHDVIFLDRRELTSWFGYLARKIYIWNAIRLSEAIFTVSEFSKRRIFHHFKANKEIIVTYSAISSAIKEESKRSYSKTNPPYIIYVGNIKKHKGLGLLLEGYNRAVKSGYEPDLYLVGSAERFRTVDNELSELLQANSKVKFTGFLPNEKLFKLISEAKALVLPSYYEGFGLTPLESLYLGTDVIISDIDVLKEIYGDLPVTFFKCGDVDDLSFHLQTQKSLIEEIQSVRMKINAKYNFRDITNKILKTIIYY